MITVSLLCAVIVDVGLVPVPNDFATEELLSRAKVLYSEERLNDCEYNVMTDSEYERFMSDFEGSSDVRDRARLVNYLIGQIEKIKFPVGPVNDECLEWFNQRAELMYIFPIFYRPFEGDEACACRFAALIGKVKALPYDPDNMGRRVRETPEQRQKRINNIRVSEINQVINRFRNGAFDTLNSHIRRQARELNDSDFEFFTNKLVRLTNATDAERLHFIEQPTRMLRKSKSSDNDVYPYPRLTGDRHFDSLADILRKKSLYPAVRRGVYLPFRAHAFRILEERFKDHAEVENQYVPLVWWIRIMKEENGRYAEKCFDAEEQSSYISERLLEWKKLGRYTDADIDEIRKILEPELGVKIELKE